MKNLDMAIIETLGAVATKYKRPYCYPSQDHICKLLSLFHGLRISRRTLNRRLAALELETFFTRIRRHREGANGKIIFNTTLYKFRKKFFKFLGLLKGRVDRFFSLFHVPFLAQYQATTPQGSSGIIPERGSVAGQQPLGGGRSAALSGNQARKNLERLQILIKAVAGSR